MKRLVAIFTLVIFCLNILGYYGMFVGLKIQLAQEIQKKFDNGNYATGQEVIFKVPLILPYPTESATFERVDGEFVHQGETFRLVKQKLYKDTLHIVCFKDLHAKTINKVLADYVKTFSDNQSSEKNQTKSVSPVSKDYFSSIIGLKKIQSFWVSLISWISMPILKTSSFQSRLIQPPWA